MSYVNLLPEDYVARRTQRRTNLLCSILFCLVIAGVIGAAVVSEQAHRRTREVNERVNDSYGEAGQLIEELQNLEVIKSRMVAKADLTAGLLERVPRSYLLATVTNALPPGGSLLSFDLTTARMMSTIVTRETTRFDQASGRPKAADAGRLEVRLVIIGLAGTDVEVAKFISQMARCSLMASVDLIYSEEKEVEKTMVRTFRVEMVLRGDADVREANTTADLAVAGQEGGRS